MPPKPYADGAVAGYLDDLSASRDDCATRHELTWRFLDAPPGDGKR